MGCYNLTCYLSNLPIRHTDEVVTMILQDNKLAGEYATPCVYWAPAPVFFYGKYDDYGAAEECHGSQLEYILDEYRNNIIEREESNEYRDDSISRDEFDINSLWVANHGNLLRMSCPDGFRRQLSGHTDPYLKHTLVMMRQDVFDAMLERFTWEEYVASDQPYRIHNYKSLCAEIPKYIKIIKEFHNLNPSNPAHLLQLHHGYPSCDKDYKNPDNIHNELGMWLYYYGQAHRDFFNNSFSERIKNLAINDRDEELTEVLTEFAKYITLNRAIGDARRCFVPPTGSSQESDADTQIMFAEITKEIGWEMGRETREENEAWDPVREISICQEEIKF